MSRPWAAHVRATFRLTEHISRAVYIVSLTPLSQKGATRRLSAPCNSLSWQPRASVKPACGKAEAATALRSNVGRGSVASQRILRRARRHLARVAPGWAGFVVAAIGRSDSSLSRRSAGGCVCVCVCNLAVACRLGFGRARAQGEETGRGEPSCTGAALTREVKRKCFAQASARSACTDRGLTRAAQA